MGVWMQAQTTRSRSTSYPKAKHKKEEKARYKNAIKALGIASKHVDLNANITKAHKRVDLSTSMAKST